MKNKKQDLYEKEKMMLSREDPSANSLLEFFLMEMGDTDSICIPMITLEKIFKCHRKTIKRRIDTLVERNFITIFKVGNMNIYKANKDVTFSQYETDIWSAKFKTTIHLDLEDQSDAIKENYKIGKDI